MNFPISTETLIDMGIPVEEGTLGRPVRNWVIETVSPSGERQTWARTPEEWVKK